MYLKNQKAFTMVELVFVIVIIGILSGVAIPKLAATRDDAVITKAISTAAAVQNALATERQKRILRGNFANITDLADTNGANNLIFDEFDDNSTVLEYPLRSCVDGNARGCWISGANNTYTFRMPDSTNNVAFTLANNRFTCDTANARTGEDCRDLTE